MWRNSLGRNGSGSEIGLIGNLGIRMAATREEEGKDNSVR